MKPTKPTPEKTSQSKLRRDQTDKPTRNRPPNNRPEQTRNAAKVPLPPEKAGARAHQAKLTRTARAQPRAPLGVCQARARQGGSTQGRRPDGPAVCPVSGQAGHEHAPSKRLLEKAQPPPSPPHLAPPLSQPRPLSPPLLCRPALSPEPGLCCADGEGGDCRWLASCCLPATWPLGPEGPPLGAPRRGARAA